MLGIPIEKHVEPIRPDESRQRAEFGEEDAALARSVDDLVTRTAQPH